MKLFENHIFWFIPAITVALGIFLLSTFLSVPITSPIEISFLDKLQHAFAYAVLMISFLVAFKKSDILTDIRIILLLISASCYGILLELTQYVFFANRYFECLDALSNVVGVFVGFGLFKLFHRG